MSDERNDDEILGRALSRAIETQDVAETPYERSRLAVRPLRRGIPVWQMLGAAAALVLAVAFGTWFTRPTETPGVAASPSRSASAVPQATGTVAPTATPSATPRQTAVDHDRIFFVRRDGVPVGIHVAGSGTGDTAAERVTSRLRALLSFKDPASLPPEVDNVAGVYLQVGSVTVTGDLATANLVTPNGSDPVFASELVPGLLAKQVVYTATEEPGIRRVTITVNGHLFQTQVLGVTSWPKQREDVFGYGLRGPLGKDSGISFSAATGDPATNTFALRSTTFQGSLVRFTFEGLGADSKVAPFAPFQVWMQSTDDPQLGGKYALSVVVPYNGPGETGGAAHVGFVNESPVVSTVQADRSFTATLDDARPWRAYMPDASHLVVEIGGDPRMVSDRIALAAPQFGTAVPATFAMNGLARTFEANVVWRVRDTTGRVIASGHTTASVGTSSIWGTFSTRITVPAVTFPGQVALEVYEVSPKDGSEQGMVSIPLFVR